MVQIPFAEFPAFTEIITLDNTPYKLSFHWNTRGEFWDLIFYDREENILCGGINLVLSYELIRSYPDRGLPPGAMFVIDPSNLEDNIGREDFVNDRALQLFYITGEEYAAKEIQ